jgi:hypothetical protein
MEKVVAMIRQTLGGLELEGHQDVITICPSGGRLPVVGHLQGVFGVFSYY